MFYYDINMEHIYVSLNMLYISSEYKEEICDWCTEPILQWKAGSDSR